MADSQGRQLRPFACETSAAFEVLNDPARGIAVVPMPDKLDPQTLIKQLGDLLTERGLHAGEPVFHYRGAQDLMPDPAQPPDGTAIAFDQRYRAVRTAVESVTADVMRPYPYQVKPMPRIFAVIGHFGEDQLHEHPDGYIMTSWLGVSQPGLTLKTTQGKEIPVDALPPRSLLMTRQAGWRFTAERTASELGIEHRVDWKGAHPGEVRVVGLDHRQVNMPGQIRRTGDALKPTFDLRRRA